MQEIEEIAAEKSRKRKQRAILSCTDCRRRKLKCDRELPCNRCIKGGVSEKCTYTTEGEDDPSMRRRARLQGHRPSQAPSASNCEQSAEASSDIRVLQLEQQVIELQDLVRSLQNRSGEPPSSTLDSTSSEEASHNSVGLFKGEGVRTFYYGPTSPITVVAHFPDLRPFMKKVFVGSALQRLREETRAEEDRVRAKQASRGNGVLTISNLRSLLPDRNAIEKVIRTYFDTFETTYRILHAPTFWANYETYWNEPFEPNSDMDAIMLAILACTLCVSTHETPKYSHDGSNFRSKAIVWLRACEAWLRRHSNKRRTLASLQVRLLRLLALSTTCVKTKECYQEVQAQVAFMVSSGMHRDPRILGSSCSIFEGEMRRRLWATTMELEMQASIDKGIPSILTSLEYDCASPRNLDDADLQEDMQYLPESRPSSVYTDTSFLYHSVPSLYLRARLCANLNSFKSIAPFSETLQDEQDIHSALKHLPAWKDSRALQASTLLEVQLRQFLVLLHSQKTLRPHSRSDPNLCYAFVTTIEACESLIYQHAKLLDAGNFALCCIRFDYLRAIMVLCHIAYYASLASDTLVSRLAYPAFAATSDPALRLIATRSLRPGRGNHHYWYVSAAISLVTTQIEPEKAAMAERQASDRVCKLLYQILSLQDEDHEPPTQQVVFGEQPNAVLHTPISLVDPGTGVMGDTAGFPLMSGDELGELGADIGLNGWMLDDSGFLGDFNGVGIAPGF